jgi:hypothetical protein
VQRLKKRRFARFVFAEQACNVTLDAYRLSGDEVPEQLDRDRDKAHRDSLRKDLNAQFYESGALAMPTTTPVASR